MPDPDVELDESTTWHVEDPDDSQDDCSKPDTD
jgi:hypothetical protein